MKVAFELTPVGSGHYYPRNRTGIFRVCCELLAALARRPEVELVLTAAKCRGEAEAELGFQGLTREVHRSKLERACFPIVQSMCIPSDFQPETQLSDRRRKWFRTFIDALEGLGGHPREVAKHVDVCHSPYLPPSQVGWSAKCEAARMVTVHDLLPLTHREFFPSGDDQLLRRVLADIEQGAVAHCVSEFTKAELVRQLPEAATRAFVVPLAARSDHFYPRELSAVAALRSKLELEGPYVLCLGTVDARKNLALAFEAFEHVRKHRKDVKLVVTGATARTATALETLLSRYPAAKDGCVVTGFLPDVDLPALYSGASLVLFPSFAEGFGLPALEAMSCGAPLLASNTCSLPEVVGEGGVLLDPHDGRAWSETALALLTSESERTKLSAAGLERSRAFSWNATASALTQAYRTFARA